MDTKTINSAIEIARKANGAKRYHAAQNLSQGHKIQAVLVPEGTDIFQLPSGLWYGRHLKNAPDFVQNEFIHISVQMVDGKSKRYEVWSTKNGRYVVNFTGWNDLEPAWRLPIIGRQIPLEQGVSGTALMNVYNVGDHTETDLELDLNLDYPGNYKDVLLGQQSPGHNYVKGRSLDFCGFVHDDHDIPYPADINWTASGHLHCISEHAGRHLTGYLHVALEPDGPQWTQWQKLPNF